MQGGKPVLTFHDSSLYAGDLKAVKGSGWFTSNVVDFFFSYLEHVRYKEHLGRAKALLLHPGPLFIMAFTDDPEELRESLASLELAQQSVVLLPINDENSVDMSAARRGTHWSLLVFERAGNCFRHYDSSHNSNEGAARNVAKKLVPLLECGPQPKFVAADDAAQQTNGYDCGVYMCANADRILSQLVVNERHERLFHVDQITPELVKQYRVLIHETAAALIK